MVRNGTVKDKERKFLIECIGLYRSLPALWQIKSKIYHNREKKNMAYDVLLAKYNKMFPEATKEDLKKKINSLRTNYRKELKKCVSSEASADSKYVPTLWYFQEMNFLRDQELSLDSGSLYVHTIDSPDRDIVNQGQRSESPSSMDDKLESRPCQTPSYATNTHPSLKRKRKKRLLKSYEPVSEFKDEYHHWGMACAADLRKMERTQQIYAKKAIAEILMEAQLGLLHRHSVKINENTSSNCAVEFGAWASQYVNQSPSPPTSLSYNNASPSYKPDPVAIANACKSQLIGGENNC